jgi:hypothetical protein
MLNIDLHRQSPQAGGDILPLGKNPQLIPLNASAIRRQLSLSDPHCLSDQRRAALLMLSRITDYYDVVGYTPPIITKARKEVGIALGPWHIKGSGYEREIYPVLVSPLWQQPEKIFLRVRFLCADAALRVAMWEFETELPESKHLLQAARLAALAAIQSNVLTGRRWASSRRLFDTKGFSEHLKNTSEKAEQGQFIAGRISGKFVPQAEEI